MKYLLPFVQVQKFDEAASMCTNMFLSVLFTIFICFYVIFRSHNMKYGL